MFTQKTVLNSLQFTGRFSCGYLIGYGVDISGFSWYPSCLWSAEP